MNEQILITNPASSTGRRAAGWGRALARAFGLVAGVALLAQPAMAGKTDFDDVFPSLKDGVAIGDSIKLGIDPSLLTLSHDATVTAYFVSEGAGYRNSFGWYNGATDPRDYENRNLIWKNASAKGSGGSLKTGSKAKLGKFSAGDSLGFYLTANGYYYGNRGNTYYTDDSINPDGISHVVAGILPEEGLLAIGFEDLYGGGDRDYDDVVFAIDIGVENAKQIAAGAPEPSEWALMMVGFSTLVGWQRRRLLKRKAAMA